MVVTDKQLRGAAMDWWELDPYYRQRFDEAWGDEDEDESPDEGTSWRDDYDQ